jgi:outer membrane protein assembly factor BamB
LPSRRDWQATASFDPFYGLDLASGKKVWEYEAASPVTSSPAVAKDKVVVATADRQVICFG